jgi:hypothetical protein
MAKALPQAATADQKKSIRDALQATISTEAPDTEGCGARSSVDLGP